MDAPLGRADEPVAGLPLAALSVAGRVDAAAAAPVVAAVVGAVDVVPGVAPSVIGSAAASAAAPGTSVAPVVVGVGGVTPVELVGVGAGVPDGRAVEGL